MSKDTADVVVIGGGVVGAAIAFELARAGCRDVILLEKGFLACGSTGRCGAGVRQQWGTVTNCTLARESVRIFETMDDYLDYTPGVEFRQGGYLILAYTDKQWEQFRRNVELQRSLGIEVEMLSPAEARGIVPYLNTEGLVGATFCRKDGHANPFHVTLAYARAAARLGVDIRTRTEVTGIDVKAGRIRSVHTSKGTIHTSTVMNCAGPYAGVVAAMAGLQLPLWAERHQILVTEPVEPIQDPMVISFHHR
ncbi:MAG: FAD-binding oxidoreductase, partial [Firmicutes bacterium]|nr:FAD-binding oxidoreductase [Bacillota bacterium]